MFVLVSSFVFVSVTVFISVSVKAFIKQFIKTYMSEFFRKNLPESPSLRNSVLTYTINYCIISTVKEIQTTHSCGLNYVKGGNEMSHNIHHADYPLNVNRGKVQAEWDNYAAHEDWREGCSGLPNPIRWLEIGISETYQDAMKRIDEIDNGWYDQIAVKYKEYKPKATKKRQELELRLREAMSILTERRNKVHYAARNVSSEYIGCKECGSKIVVKYIKSNRCPVCGHDLRPASALEAIKRAEAKVTELQKKLDEESKKGKYEVRWLVKIEYHT